MSSPTRRIRFVTSLPIVGKIMYAMMATHPDLAFAVSTLRRFGSSPCKSHLGMHSVCTAILSSLPLPGSCNLGILHWWASVTLTGLGISILEGPLQVVSSWFQVENQKDNPPWLSPPAQSRIYGCHRCLKRSHLAPCLAHRGLFRIDTKGSNPQVIRIDNRHWSFQRMQDIMIEPSTLISRSISLGKQANGVTSCWNASLQRLIS